MLGALQRSTKEKPGCYNLKKEEVFISNSVTISITQARVGCWVLMSASKMGAEPN